MSKPMFMTARQQIDTIAALKQHIIALEALAQNDSVVTSIASCRNVIELISAAVNSNGLKSFVAPIYNIEADTLLRCIASYQRELKIILDESEIGHFRDRMDETEAIKARIEKGLGR